jgi:hypothetical protein
MRRCARWEAGPSWTSCFAHTGPLGQALLRPLIEWESSHPVASPAAPAAPASTPPVAASGNG